MNIISFHRRMRQQIFCVVTIRHSHHQRHTRRPKRKCPNSTNEFDWSNKTPGFSKRKIVAADHRRPSPSIDTWCIDNFHRNVTKARRPCERQTAFCRSTWAKRRFCMRATTTSTFPSITNRHFVARQVLNIITSIALWRHPTMRRFVILRLPRLLNRHLRLHILHRHLQVNQSTIHDSWM